MPEHVNYMYPLILRDLKDRHPREDHNRLAALAGWIYQSEYAFQDSWGKLQYHSEVRRRAPRCFADSPKIGQVDPEVIQLYLDRRVGDPPVEPIERPLSEADEKIREAEDLEKKWTTALTELRTQ